MPKASTRFRNRKINFKSRLTVRIGNHDVDFDDEENGFEEVEFEEDKSAKHGGGGGGVETGVDKDEEGEFHLQAVLARSTAAVTQRTAPGRTKAVDASIPTPDATGTIDAALFRSLYPPNSFAEPHGYIRFSDTVEDAQTGAASYTMDEDDEDWLEAYNANVGKAVPPESPQVGEEGTPGKGSRSARQSKKQVDDKAKEAALGPISEDDFEAVCELFEKVTEEKAPMAHVPPHTLPELDTMETAFIDGTSQHPKIQTLKIYARVIFPHWKERKERRNGKPIIPQLDYDESNESNPYVCFRRRELKSSRKTRRSDAQNIERLVRLRNDLFAAHALMLRVRDREKLKLEMVRNDRQIFEGRVEMRELKRRLGEADGDEELLIGRKDKKRRREELGQPANSSLRLSLRKPDGGAEVFSPASLILSVEGQRALKEKAALINGRVEREIQRKREADQIWEDWTDGAYHPQPLSVPARHWRTAEPISATIPFGPNEVREAIGFPPYYQPAIGAPRASFRVRHGRGGRLMLDRIAVDRLNRKIKKQAPAVRSIFAPPTVSSDDEDDAEEEEEDPDVVARREERQRYDQDWSDAFPTVDEPTVIDDFDFSRLVQRSKLLRPMDIESLSLDMSHLDEAFGWTAREPERFPPPQMYGRPAPRTLVPPPQQQPQQHLPGGPPVGTPTGAPGPATAAQLGQMQMMAAANQAHRAAQQAAQLKRSAGSPQDGMHTPGPVNGSPAALPGQSLPLNGPPMPQPIPWANHAGANGAVPKSEPMNGMVLPPGYQNIQAYAQQLPPGHRLTPLPNGANGLPATSRLSQPPFVNGAQLPVPMHPGMQVGSPHGMQMMARPPSANGQLPSRPGSAASSHPSPVGHPQQLPMQPITSMQPLTSPGLRPNGKRHSSSPMLPPQMVQQVGMMKAGMPIQTFNVNGFAQQQHG